MSSYTTIVLSGQYQPQKCCCPARLRELSIILLMVVCSSCDCVGILKERYVDVEQRQGEQHMSSKSHKTTKCRLVFRAVVQMADGLAQILQIASQPISCSKLLCCSSRRVWPQKGSFTSVSDSIEACMSVTHFFLQLSLVCFFTLFHNFQLIVSNHICCVHMPRTFRYAKQLPLHYPLIVLCLLRSSTTRCSWNIAQIGDHLPCNRAASNVHYWEALPKGLHGFVSANGEGLPSARRGRTCGMVKDRLPRPWSPAGGELNIIVLLLNTSPMNHLDHIAIC